MNVSQYVIYDDYIVYISDHKTHNTLITNAIQSKCMYEHFSTY